MTRSWLRVTTPRRWPVMVGGVLLAWIVLVTVLIAIDPAGSSGR